MTGCESEILKLLTNKFLASHGSFPTAASCFLGRVQSLSIYTLISMKRKQIIRMELVTSAIFQNVGAALLTWLSAI